MCVCARAPRPLCAAGSRFRGAASREGRGQPPGRRAGRGWARGGGAAAGGGPCRGGVSTFPVRPGELGQVWGGRGRSPCGRAAGKPRAPPGSAAAALAHGRHRSLGLGGGARSCGAAVVTRRGERCGGVRVGGAAPSQGDWVLGWGLLGPPGAESGTRSVGNPPASAGFAGAGASCRASLPRRPRIPAAPAARLAGGAGLGAAGKSRFSVSSLALAAAGMDFGSLWGNVAVLRSSSASFQHPCCRAGCLSEQSARPEAALLWLSLFAFWVYLTAIS